MQNSNSKVGTEVPQSTEADVTSSSQTIAKPHVVGSASLELGLYDSRTGGSVTAYSMFDATGMCPGSKRCVIKYADVARGRIAQICDWYKADRDLGTTVHYHINEMTVKELAQDEVFARHAKMMAVEANVLAKSIFDNQ